MSDFSNDDIKNLARLAKIRISDDEIDLFKKELSSIRAHVDQIQSANTDGVESTILSNGVENVEREDDVATHDTKRILKGVPQTKDTYIQVPKVL